MGRTQKRKKTSLISKEGEAVSCMEISEKNTQYRETISTNILSQELAQNSEEIGEVSSVVGWGEGGGDQREVGEDRQKGAFLSIY